MTVLYVVLGVLLYFAIGVAVAVPLARYEFRTYAIDANDTSGAYVLIWPMVVAVFLFVFTVTAMSLVVGAFVKPGSKSNVN